MKLGARIIKTGLAVILSLYVATWFNLEPITFAALAAAFAVQPSIYRSLQTIFEQVQANVVGALLAVIFVMTFGQEPFVVGLVVALTIAIIIKAKLESSTIPLAIVTVIIVMESPVTNFIEFATERFILIIIGVLSAFVINLFFIPPRYETKLYHKIVKITEDLSQWIHLVIQFDADFSSLKKDFDRIEESLIKLDNLYLLFKEERDYFQRNKYAKARKVVLFRQMILATKEAASLLRILNKRSEELKLVPYDVHVQLQQQLEHLIAYHRRILLRYAGKVQPLRSEQLIDDMNRGNEALMDFFIRLREEAWADHEHWLLLLSIVSEMVEYQEQLEHLDSLVKTFFKFHKKDNKVEIKEIDDL